MTLEFSLRRQRSNTASWQYDVQSPKPEARDGRRSDVTTLAPEWSLDFYIDDLSPTSKPLVSPSQSCSITALPLELRQAIVNRLAAPDVLRLGIASRALWEATYSKPTLKSALHRAGIDRSLGGLEVPQLYALVRRQARIQQQYALGHCRTAMIRGHDARVLSVGFSNDSQAFVTASADHTARVYQGIFDKPKLIRLSGHQGYVRSATFSTDSQSVVTTSTDGTSKSWDLREPNPQGVDVLGRNVQADLFATFDSVSPDGGFMVTRSPCGQSVDLWALCPRPAVSIGSMPSHSPVSCIAFSPDGRFIAMGAEDGHAKIWDFDPQGERLPCSL